MKSTINIIRKSDLTTSKWSGGTTTQLAIHPKNGDYGNRIFNWRLSTATVEVHESNFTPLPHTKRLIMSLSGDLELIHENHHSCKLKPFEVDSFDGAWSTKSIGKVTDFNLMLKGEYKGDIYTISLLTKERKFITFKQIFDTRRPRTMAIYCIEGKLKFKFEGKEYILNQMDLLIIEIHADEFNGIEVTNESVSNINIVVSEIGC